MPEDYCDKIENWAGMSTSDRKAFIEEVINEIMMEGNGYQKVDIESYPDSAPKCASGSSACWDDDDKKLYYSESELLSNMQISRSEDAPPINRMLNTLAHEALHAMDYQDYGSSDLNDQLGDEKADHHTTRLSDPMGERNETRYEQGEVIPGNAHTEEVYKPADAIANALLQICDEAKDEGRPLSLESVKRRLSKKIADLLKKRWKP